MKNIISGDLKRVRNRTLRGRNAGDSVNCHTSPVPSCLATPWDHLAFSELPSVSKPHRPYSTRATVLREGGRASSGSPFEGTFVHRMMAEAWDCLFTSQQTRRQGWPVHSRSAPWWPTSSSWDLSPRSSTAAQNSVISRNLVFQHRNLRGDISIHILTRQLRGRSVKHPCTPHMLCDSSGAGRPSSSPALPLSDCHHYIRPTVSILLWTQGPFPVCSSHVTEQNKTRT